MTVSDVEGRSGVVRGDSLLVWRSFRARLGFGKGSFRGQSEVVRGSFAKSFKSIFCLLSNLDINLQGSPFNAIERGDVESSVMS